RGLLHQEDSVAPSTQAPKNDARQGIFTMAMDVGGAKGGIKSDINVTPLVDVMLVLLIIMMLVAPLLQQGVNVKLPEAENTVDKPEVSDQTVVAIAANKALYLNAKEISESELATRVSEILENRTEKI